MTDRSGSQAGGVLLALAIVVGAIGGGIAHQATIGVLIGTGVGLAAAIGLWWRDRGRTGG